MTKYEMLYHVKENGKRKKREGNIWQVENFNLEWS